MNNQKAGPHQGQKLYTAGQPLEEAKAAMILVHGRGATAPSILELARELYQPDFVYLAPQAAHNTWYPFSFMAPMENNQPKLASALQRIGEVVARIEEAGIPAEKIIIGGFSQGACLASEFVARNARRYGGLLVFSGGLIGPPGTPRDYAGSLDGTPIFLGCSDTDFHIPEERVHESTATFERLGANVTEKIYPNMGHTVIQDEIDQANKIVESVLVG
ncbi:MAG: dienelactone hydrolase family protein [Anaerolineae bacterium]|nr:dienelactone hydrolase family protein [Anaerolineae bacterium]